MSQEMLATGVVTPFPGVREDRDFYIPDYLSAGPSGIRSAAWSAADQQASDLRAAERHLDEARNLVAVLRAALEQAGDARAMQAETVLKIVESRLGQAHARIDRHDTRFMNLFLAYFDLKDRADAPGDE
jgi:nitrate reductase assembly molybdenum cofactor insertion protein NarJ